jgi:hypothetical protein
MPSEVAKSVLDWLRVAKNCLLIIDNLDDTSIVKDYLPSMDSAGHTLITTRNKNSDGIPAEGLEVPQTSPEDCVQFLLDRSRLGNQLSPECHEQAYRIVQELGYLPLAIEQAASYIRISQDLGGYLMAYNEQRHALLNWRPSGNDSYEHTVATALKLSLNRLELPCPDAFTLLQYFAFMNPDEIMVDFIKDGSETFPSDI